jgi:hypothetical protein
MKLDAGGSTGTLTYTQSGRVNGAGASTGTYKLAMTAVSTCP